MDRKRGFLFAAEEGQFNFQLATAGRDITRDGKRDPKRPALERANGGFGLRKERIGDESGQVADAIESIWFGLGREVRQRHKADPSHERVKLISIRDCAFYVQR